MEQRAALRPLVRQFTTREIADDESLFESGLLDSFSLVDLVVAIEREFGIKIPDSELRPATFDSIERMDAYLRSRS